MLIASPFYEVDLRIWHPDIDPAIITTTLNLDPGRAWKAGDKRATPAGTFLDGVHDRTYWYHAYGIPEDIGPNKLVGDILVQLEQYRDFFHSLVKDGGICELYLTLTANQNMGETFCYDTLDRFARLKINLSLELFP